MSSFTVLGTAGPFQVGHAPGKVWVGGAFLSPEDARRLSELTGQAAADADEEPEAEHPVEPGQFL